MTEPNTRTNPSMDQATDPIAFFDLWMKDAKASELNDPNAMALATATPEGIPSVRIVLLKRYDASGFCFYTNGESRKGGELRANAHAALCLHWKSRQRQVRVEGPITELPPADVDAYFHRRHRMSQIGAWASQQSRPLDSRDALMARTAEIEQRFPGEVPRPPYWTGFRVQPLSIEFWQEADFRLHDRVVFTPRGDGAWTKQRLYPEPTHPFGILSAAKNLRICPCSCLFSWLSSAAKRRNLLHLSNRPIFEGPHDRPRPGRPHHPTRSQNPP